MLEIRRKPSSPGPEEHSLQAVIAHARDSNRAKLGMQAATFKTAVAGSTKDSNGKMPLGLGQQDVKCFKQTGRVTPMQNALAAAALGVLERASVIRDGWVRKYNT